MRAREATRSLSIWSALIVSMTLSVACDGVNVASSLTSASPADASAASDAGRGSDEDPLLIVDDERQRESPRDPTLGGRCLDDEQCDDGISCTFDECDVELERCRFTPDDTSCQDELYCNGRETCLPGVGCSTGQVVSCDDQSPCTIDRCVEETRGCERTLRDVDGDGDPDAHCGSSAGDCDDQDVLVSSLAPEVCDNQIDDDCDGERDESECQTAEYDSCLTPLQISDAGTVWIPFSAATPNTSSTCSPPGARDVVVAIDVPMPSDVLVSVRGSVAEFAATLRSACDEPDDELACASAYQLEDGSGVARFRVRAYGPGPLYLWLFAFSSSELELSVDFEAPSEAPVNEGCATATRIEPGEFVLAPVIGSAASLKSRCGDDTGEVVYDFELQETSDVRVLATAVERESEPVVSLRSESCQAQSSELSCVRSGDVELFARALEPGRYFLAVSATTASDVTLLFETSAASVGPAGDTCDVPESIPTGRVFNLDLSDYADELQLPCFPSGRDAVMAIRVEERSDILLKQRLTYGDSAAIALLDASCDQGAPLTCVAGRLPPLRAVAHDIAAGEYLVVAESELANPTSVLVAARPAQPPILAAAADDCDSTLLIPPTGGYFTGNTNQASADFSASCDVAGVTLEGAPDQLLELRLEERSRVILDAAGSRLQTIVNLRRGEQCPGEEIAMGCSLALEQGSYLEQVLDVGTYFVQIDGYAGNAGQWNLEVFVLPEP